MSVRGRAVAVALVFLALPGTASAYCRTTTVGVPASFKPQECFTQGLPLFWKNACVGYSVSELASARFSLDTVTPVIDQAFSSFNAIDCSGTPLGVRAQNLGAVACGDVRYNTAGTNSNLVVFRDDAWPHSDPTNTLALTTVTFNADTGEIYDADMEVNSSDKNLTIGDPVPGDGFDLLAVMTHEVGHFFGLAHATDNKAAMYASYKPGATEMRTLKPDDIEGMCAIYPSTTRRSVSASVSTTGFVEAAACDPTPRRGQANDCGSSSAASQEQSKGCAMGYGASGGPAGLAAVAALGLVVVRRRRAARSRR